MLFEVISERGIPAAECEGSEMWEAFPWENKKGLVRRSCNMCNKKLSDLPQATAGQVSTHVFQLKIVMVLFLSHKCLEVISLILSCGEYGLYTRCC